MAKYSKSVQEVLDDARERRGDLTLGDEWYADLGIKAGLSLKGMTDHELIQVLFMETRWALAMGVKENAELVAKLDLLSPKNRSERRRLLK